MQVKPVSDHNPRPRPTLSLLVFGWIAAATLMATSAQSSLAPPAAATDPRRISFDVVSIKRDKTGLGPATIQSPPNGDSITITNMSLRMMVGIAYDLPLHDQITGLPGWADTDSYDLNAKVATSDLPAFHMLLPRQRSPMLQPVLESCFHMNSHYQARELPAYALIIAKNGVKLTEVTPAIGPNGLKDPGGIRRVGRAEIVAEGAPIANLLDVLAQQLGRPVVDQTGLKGNYNFTLQWTPDSGSTTSSDAAANSGPSIFTAVQEQLGLKLQAIKTPTQTLVIDHIERPEEN